MYVMIEVTEPFYFEFIEMPHIKRLIHGGKWATIPEGKRFFDRMDRSLSQITEDERFYLADRFFSEIPDRERIGHRLYVQLTSNVLMRGLAKELSFHLPGTSVDQFSFLRVFNKELCWVTTAANVTPEPTQIKQPDEFVRIVKERLACKK
jgi:hypothetical protein